MLDATPSPQMIAAKGVHGLKGMIQGACSTLEKGSVPNLSIFQSNLTDLFGSVTRALQEGGEG